jgi:hypothetical protein
MPVCGKNMDKHNVKDNTALEEITKKQKRSKLKRKTE